MSKQRPADSPRSKTWAPLALTTPVVALLVACCWLVVPAASATPLTWSPPTTIDPGHSLTAISCPFAPPLPEALCAAVDNAGNVLVSTNPSGGVSTWQTTNIDGSTPLTAVSCQREACVAVDGLGNVLIGVPGEPGTWSKTAIDASNGGLTGVSCPPRDIGQVGFCLAVDHAGNAVLTFNGGSPWNIEPIDAPSGHLTGLSCTEFSEWCIAWDDLGNVLTSGDPYEGASAWTVTNVDPDANLTGVSCPYTDTLSYYNPWEYCLAVDDGGNVLGAAKPSGGASAWTTSHIEAHGLTGVSCPFAGEAQFCATVDDVGDVVTSSQPLGGAADWSVTPIDPGTSLTGVSCPYDGDSAFCVAIDASGNVIVGTSVSETPPKEEPAPPEEPHHEAPTPQAGGGGTDPAATLTHDGGVPAVSVISTAQLKALLARQLTPSGKAATIAALLKHGGLSLRFTAPEAGNLVVQWYYVPSGAKLAKATKAKPVLIASGKLTFLGAGIGKVRLTLTAGGRKLLRHVRRVGLVAKGTFVSRGGALVGSVKTVELAR